MFRVTLRITIMSCLGPGSAISEECAQAWLPWWPTRRKVERRVVAARMTAE